jgi:hypothetical protein
MHDEQIGRARYCFVSDKEMPKIAFKNLGKNFGEVEISSSFVALR